MPSIARTERLALADLLAELGPEAPTLCGGWDTRSLAAHLVVRERRPDTTPGVAVSALAGWTERVQKGFEKRPYDDLVELVRTGPGRLSPFSLPGVDKFLNTTEYVVHHEDVRRAQPGWEPRDLPRKVHDALWRVVRTRSRVSFRSTRAGVVLQRSDAPRSSVTAAEGEPVATITGEPLEMLLYVFGRRDHARVEITGDDAAKKALAATSLAV
jgi:uncharacterized protein (TIGR03085 family)